MSSRVYVPATTALLAELMGGALPSSVGRLVAEDDSEDAEYAALVEAASASRALAGDDRARRVVVVAELDDPDGDVPLDRVVAVHVDEADGAAEDDDLGWYATQEIPHLLR